jgi:hypothetical protein
VTPVRWWWAILLRLEFALVALLKRVLRQTLPSRAVRRLSFISFARWALVKRIPPEPRSGRRGKRLPHSYIVFQSNFYGAPQEYFEAFARGLKWRMRGLWGGAYRVPDPNQLAEFSVYINDAWIPAQHYYAAYPNASTKMVLAAVELRKHFHEFAEQAPELDPDRFAAEYARFLVRVQRYL